MEVVDLQQKPSFSSVKQQFKKNLKGVNGNQDFDQDMLEDIYCAIK